MDIINHYSAGIPYAAPRTVNQSEAGAPEIQYKSGSEYREMINELESKNSGKIVDPSTKLYNGSAARAKLSDTEIAVLANKYDVHDMSDEEFDAFLDDLESMGAVSDFERRQLGYKGLCSFDMNELHAWTAPLAPNGSKLLFDRWEADGDISRWINERIQWERGVWSSDPAKKKEQEDYEELHSVLAGVINRMDAQQKSNAEEAQKKELVRQLADGNSEFYANMRTTLKAQVKKNKEDQEEQAIIDAMAAVLDAMSGRETVSGDKTSLNKSASELTKKIGERIARLKKEDPGNPEIVRLENMLKRLQEVGIYVDLEDTDDLWKDEDESFETLTQLLIRRQAEETYTTHPILNEVNEPA